MTAIEKMIEVLEAVYKQEAEAKQLANGNCLVGTHIYVMGILFDLAELAKELYDKERNAVAL